MNFIHVFLGLPFLAVYAFLYLIVSIIAFAFICICAAIGAFINFIGNSITPAAACNLVDYKIEGTDTQMPDKYKQEIRDSRTCKQFHGGKTALSKSVVEAREKGRAEEQKKKSDKISPSQYQP